MSRAGIFIGVDRTGQLQTLNDAAAGARRMYEWALHQGMTDGTHARLITDEGGQKVTPDMVYDAIKAVIDGAGVDFEAHQFLAGRQIVHRHIHRQNLSVSWSKRQKTPPRPGQWG